MPEQPCTHYRAFLISMSELIRLEHFLDHEIENMLRAEKSGLTRAALREVLILRCESRAVVQRNSELRQQMRDLRLPGSTLPPNCS